MKYIRFRASIDARHSFCLETYLRVVSGCWYFSTVIACRPISLFARIGVQSKLETNARTVPLATHWIPCNTLHANGINSNCQRQDQNRNKVFVGEKRKIRQRRRGQWQRQSTEYNLFFFPSFHYSHPMSIVCSSFFVFCLFVIVRLRAPTAHFSSRYNGFGWCTSIQILFSFHLVRRKKTIDLRKILWMKWEPAFLLIPIIIFSSMLSGASVASNNIFFHENCEWNHSIECVRCDDWWRSRMFNENR